MLLLFLVKRMLVLAPMGAAAAFVLSGYNAAAPFGIILGVFFAIYKIRFNKKLISAGTVGASKIKNSLVHILFQFAPFILLFVTAATNTVLFICFSAGLLILPFFICVNAITEKLRLSHNAFGNTVTLKERQ
jgi:hypothetical protein